MNRIQYYILLGGSGAVVLLLLFQAVFNRQAQYSQSRLMAAQAMVNQNQSYIAMLHQLAGHIYQVSQQTQDQQLKDLLTRQHIIVRVGSQAPPSPPAELPVSNGSSSVPGP
jgi:hypothetical protein